MGYKTDQRPVLLTSSIRVHSSRFYSKALMELLYYSLQLIFYLACRILLNKLILSQYFSYRRYFYLFLHIALSLCIGRIIVLIVKSQNLFLLAGGSLLNVQFRNLGSKTKQTTTSLGLF